MRLLCLLSLLFLVGCVHKCDDDGISSYVTRKFFLQMDIKSDNFIDDSF